MQFGGFYNSVPSVLREKEPPERCEMERVAHAGTAVRRTGLLTLPAFLAENATDVSKIRQYSIVDSQCKESGLSIEG